MLKLDHNIVLYRIQNIGAAHKLSNAFLALNPAFPPPRNAEMVDGSMLLVYDSVIYGQLQY